MDKVDAGFLGSGRLKPVRVSSFKTGNIFIIPFKGVWLVSKNEGTSKKGIRGNNNTINKRYHLLQV
jgi:hypothetical protein